METDKWIKINLQILYKNNTHVFVTTKFVLQNIVKMADSKISKKTKNTTTPDKMKKYQRKKENFKILSIVLYIQFNYFNLIEYFFLLQHIWRQAASCVEAP